MLGILIPINVCFWFFAKPAQPRTICFENNCFNLEFALTQQQKAIGLMNYIELTSETAMLFVYNQPQTVGIWMKNMHFPLDIIWLDENLNIINLVKNAPPCQVDQACPSYTKNIPTNYVLEIKAGLIDQFGLELGQTAEFKL
jgi:hypothetical protein